MARFDVYAHPDSALRKTTPFLLDVQNQFIHGLETRIVIPMRAVSRVRAPLRDLHPEFEVQGSRVILDTPAIAAFPSRELSKWVANLGSQRAEIMAAMDSLFGSY
jgi:toxin CcdB